MHMMEQPMEYDDKMYKVQCDLRTLVEAGKIHMDKARYKAAMKLGEEERKALGYGYETKMK